MPDLDCWFWRLWPIVIAGFCALVAQYTLCRLLSVLQACGRLARPHGCCIPAAGAQMMIQRAINWMSKVHDTFSSCLSSMTPQRLQVGQFVIRAMQNFSCLMPVLCIIEGSGRMLRNALQLCCICKGIRQHSVVKRSPAY